LYQLTARRKRVRKVEHMKPPRSDELCSVAGELCLSARLSDPHQTTLQRELDQLRELQGRRTAEGSTIWDLSMVNPDLSPPRAVLDRLLEAVTKNSNHRYAVSRGVRRLREAFSYKYKTRFQQELNPESQVCVCLGSKDATFHALRVLLEPGDGVVVPTPTYPAHRSAVALASGRCITWEPSDSLEQSVQDLSLLLSSSKAKVLLLNFPSNPTGSIVSREWWYEIGKVCAAKAVTIVNDFVYGEMCFSGQAAESALWASEVGARCVEVYSLSKAYNVPGWRVGALVGDAKVVAAVARLKSHADYGLFLPLQYAATQALMSSEDIVAPTVQVYQRRLKVLSSGLQELGWRVVTPSAGACLWAQYPAQLAGDSVSSRCSVSVARHLLVEAGVVVGPGRVFGPNCDDWVRFAAVMNEERLRDVVSAIRGVSKER
jgi:alanine-synthesizing transaminase